MVTERDDNRNKSWFPADEAEWLINVRRNTTRERWERLWRKYQKVWPYRTRSFHGGEWADEESKREQFNEIVGRVME